MAGPVRPLPSFELGDGVTIDVVGQPFSFDPDGVAWILQLSHQGSVFEVTESVRLHGRAWNDVTMSHPVEFTEERTDNRLCTSVLGDELLRPRVRRFLAGPATGPGTWFLERNFSTFWNNIYEKFLIDVNAHVILSDRAFFHREDWNSSV